MGGSSIVATASSVSLFCYRFPSPSFQSSIGALEVHMHHHIITSSQRCTCITSSHHHRSAHASSHHHIITSSHHHIITEVHMHHGDLSTTFSWRHCRAAAFNIKLYYFSWRHQSNYYYFLVASLQSCCFQYQFITTFRGVINQIITTFSWRHCRAAAFNIKLLLLSRGVINKIITTFLWRHCRAAAFISSC